MDFNMSANLLTLSSKSTVCQLQKAKVLCSPSISKDDNLPTMDTVTIQSATLNQQNIGQGSTSVPKVDLVGAKVSSQEKVKVEQFLSNWQNVFSQSPTDLGCTNLVEHEIKLENETPFKEPYHVSRHL